MAMNYSKVLESLTTWALSNDNIRCVVLTGSAAAANEHPLSDRDMELHVRNTQALELDDAWWQRLGTVLAVEKLKNDADQPTRLIYYCGGKLDFTLVEAAQPHRHYDRAFKVLLDKDGMSANFKLSTLAPQRPDQDSFNQCVNWANAAALMLAKAIVRDEPWSVKRRDADLKSELLRVIEWDHSIRYAGARDVRYLGTSMRHWMDEAIQQRLEKCWATFDLNDSRQALLSTYALFSEVAAKVAVSAGLMGFDNEAVCEEISRILAYRTYSDTG